MTQSGVGAVHTLGFILGVQLKGMQWGEQATGGAVSSADLSRLATATGVDIRTGNVGQGLYRKMASCCTA